MCDADFMSPTEAMVLMDLARQLRAGKISLPLEIIAVKNQMEQKMRHVRLFRERLGEDDEQAMSQIVELRFLMDALYGQWVRRECAGLIR